jgi:EAL domain-containing protein (putative c-di-GMP-specific phosphodiesterase class I)
MGADARAQIELQEDLRAGLQRGELLLHYQPKVDASNGQIRSLEALVRWQHPRHGLLGPGQFIPVAERFGLINALGGWVIREACRQLGVWSRQGLRLRVSVNLSVHQVRQGHVVEQIEAALREHGVSAEQLTCEITESVAMEDTAATQAMLAGLARAGVKLSIDDFGTGYSSLSYLCKLRPQELKIDRSFVQDLETSADARAVVDAIIHLARALRLTVVAEGVETRDQAEVLLALGCDELQGFFFARPMSVQALVAGGLLTSDGQDPVEFTASAYCRWAEPAAAASQGLAHALALVAQHQLVRADLLEHQLRAQRGAFVHHLAAHDDEAAGRVVRIDRTTDAQPGHLALEGGLASWIGAAAGPGRGRAGAGIGRDGRGAAGRGRGGSGAGPGARGRRGVGPTVAAGRRHRAGAGGRGPGGRGRGGRVRGGGAATVVEGPAPGSTTRRRPGRCPPSAPHPGPRATRGRPAARRRASGRRPGCAAPARAGARVRVRHPPGAGHRGCRTWLRARRETGWARRRRPPGSAASG